MGSKILILRSKIVVLLMFSKHQYTAEHAYCSANTNIPLNTPSPGGGSGGGNRSNKLETIKNWTISTYKCSRQSLYEKLGN
jgi:hypothetical protein